MKKLILIISLLIFSSSAFGFSLNPFKKKAPVRTVYYFMLINGNDIVLAVDGDKLTVDGMINYAEYSASFYNKNRGSYSSEDPKNLDKSASEKRSDLLNRVQEQWKGWRRLKEP